MFWIAVLKMFKNNLFVLAFVAFICSVNSELNIKKCKIEDAKCLKDSAVQFTKTFAAGLQEYGIPPLEPLLIKDIDASIPLLKFKVSDVKVDGLSNCVVKKLQFDTAKSKLFLKLLCSTDIVGQYEMNGKLLLLNMEGHGKLTSKIRQALIDIEMDYVEKIKNGKKHISLTTWKNSFQLKEKCDLTFENLFNGNEVLAKVANNLIKSNTNDIIQEIGPGIVTAIASKIVKNISSFFGKLYVEEIFVN